MSGPPFWQTTRTIDGYSDVNVLLRFSTDDEQIVAMISRPQSVGPRNEGVAAEALADSFSALLRSWLADPHHERRHSKFVPLIEEVRRRNRTSRYRDACASHDFVDANMALYEAFLEVLGVEVDVNDDHHTDLWNEAWTLAKARGFERESVTAVPIVDWMENPTFGVDPASGEELKPTRAELDQILVALDFHMETGKVL